MMERFRGFILNIGAFLIMAMVLASTCYALPREGTQELLVSGGLNRTIGTGTGNFNGDLSYGWFMDQAVEAGIRQQFSYTFADDASDVWRATTAPFLDYHFNTWGKDNNILPFVGGFAGAVWNDDDFTGTVGPEAGIKAYLNEDTFILLRYQYQWFFDELDEVNDTLDSVHVMNVGLGFNW